MLFIASRGILDPASANTILGTANVVYTSDLKAAGSVKLSAQAGSAFASVNVPVSCNGVAGSTAAGTAASGNLGGSPSFSPPRTGEGGDIPLRIRPPSTGEAGLKVTNDGESTEPQETLLLSWPAPLHNHRLDSTAANVCGDQLLGEVKS